MGGRVGGGEGGWVDKWARERVRAGKRRRQSGRTRSGTTGRLERKWVRARAKKASERGRTGGRRRRTGRRKGGNVRGKGGE